MTTHSLAGKRIIITRPLPQADSFGAMLRSYGAIPILLPTITIQPPSDPGPLDQALSQLDQYDWVIFTSANAVHHTCHRASEAGRHWPSIAAIGPATAQALEHHGLSAAVIPDKHIAEALFETLAASTDLQGKSILLPQANLARPVLAQMLREAGATVNAVVAYETVRPDTDPELPPFDAITFTSSSTIHNFVDLFDDPLVVIGDAVVVVIGPVTADTAHQLGLPVHAVADPHTVEGLITALSETFKRISVV